MKVPRIEVEPVTPKLPVIKADPVNGKAAPPGAYEALNACVAYEADIALEEDIACDALVAKDAVPNNDPVPLLQSNTVVEPEFKVLKL